MASDKPHLSPEACRKRGFQKGVSGNPKGRPPVIREVKDLAQAYTVEAIESLREIMTNEKANGSARVQAAVALLDRRWGGPKQSVEVQVDHDASGLAAALAALNDRMKLTAPVVENAEIIERDGGRDGQGREVIHSGWKAAVHRAPIERGQHSVEGVERASA